MPEEWSFNQISKSGYRTFRTYGGDLDSGEVWLPMFESFMYDVSSYGNIRFSDRNSGKLPKIRLENGHAYVSLANINNSGRQNLRLAWLVLATFMGDDFEFERIIHLDGDPLNCRLDNLVWE